MTLALRAFLIAIFATIKRWKIVFFFFCLNLLFGVLITQPFTSLIEESGRQYGGAGEFITSFDPETVLDFMNQNRMSIDRFLAAGGILAILYFLLFNAVTAGAIAILADPRESTTLKTFLKFSGKYCFRFFRLIFYYAVLLTLIALLNGVLNSLITWLFEDVWGFAAGPETLGWLLFAKNVLMLIVTAFALLSLNYAKTAVVVDDGHFMGFYFVRAMGFIIAHPLVTGIYFLISLIPFTATAFLYFWLSRTIDPLASYVMLDGILPWSWVVSGSIVYLIFAQFIQFLFQACLLQRFSGQIFIYKRFMDPSSHPDPDLQKNVPDAYFVVDAPEPVAARPGPIDFTDTSAAEGKSHA